MQVKNMTEGNPIRLILSVALPLMVGNIFQQLYTVVDTMVVGKALGVDALAALGATDWLYWMWLGMIQGVTQGFGILMAREFGAKQFESLRSVVGSSTSLSALSALLFLILVHKRTRPFDNTDPCYFTAPMWLSGQMTKRTLPSIRFTGPTSAE